MSSSRLRVGTDRTDITPTLPTPLAGFAARAGLGPARHVLAPLHVRSLALRDGARPPVVLVSADLLWWADDIVAAVRAGFAHRFGLSPSSLVLHATHTHSAPQTSRLMTASLGPHDDAYLDLLLDRTLGSIARALDGETPVSVETVRTPTDATVDRRWARTAGEVPASPIDRDLTLVRLADPAGATRALLAHFACHPVVHHGNAVTPDVAGTLADALERDVTPFAMYLQGCCGDVNPARYTPDGSFADGGQDDVESLARSLAGLAERALPRATPAGEPGVSVTRRSWSLPLQERLPRTLVERMASRDDVRGEWARIMTRDRSRFERDPVLEMVRLRLTPELALLGLSGEPVSRYGLHAREVSGGRCLPMGYTDGMTTYLVTARHLEEGGYEPCEAPIYFGIPAPLAPHVERMLLAEISRLALPPAGPRVGNKKLTSR